MKRNPSPKNLDEGICQYAHCHGPVPDGISIQLCPKHLRTAYAAFIITTGVSGVAHEAAID